MARSSLYDVQGSVVDPAQPWNFDLFFDRLPTGLSGDVRSLTIRCQSTSVPGASFEAVEVELHGVKLRFRGKKQYNGTFDVTFAENVDWSTYKLFKQWHDLQLSWQRNTGSSSSVYKVSATLTTYDDAGNAVMELPIKGVWPENVQDISLDGSQGGYVQPSITFSFDYLDETAL